MEKATFNEIEAATYLGLSRATLRRARMEGSRASHFASPPYVRLGRSIRYLRRDLEAWLEKHRVTHERPSKKRH